MEAKQITIDISEEWFEENKEEFRDAILEHKDTRFDFAITIKMESFRPIMESVNKTCTFTDIMVLHNLFKSNQFEHAEWYIGIFKGEINFMIKNHINNKDAIEMISRKLNKFDCIKILSGIINYSKNDECLEFYISVEKYILEKVQESKEDIFLTNLRYDIATDFRKHIMMCIGNNNYKILCKYMELVKIVMKGYDSTSADINLCFFSTILLNKLEYADLLLNYIDLEFNYHPDVDSKYMSKLHIDAVDYLHDLINKKGLDLPSVFTYILIRNSIEEDKYEVFCHAIKCFPEEALKVGNANNFSLTTLRYLLKLHELQQLKAVS